MPRNGAGVFSLPPGTAAVSGATANSSDVNDRFADLESDANVARPVSAGGTGSTSASAARTALGVEILDEDDMASDSATQLASQQSIKAFVEAHVDSKRWTSSAQTITSGGLLTVEHSLGVVPGLYQLRLVCNDAGGDAGFSQNDQVYAGINSSGTTTNRFSSVIPSSTNVQIRFSNATNVFAVAHKTTGAPNSLDNSKWDLYLELYA